MNTYLAEPVFTAFSAVGLGLSTYLFYKGHQAEQDWAWRRFLYWVAAIILADALVLVLFNYKAIA